MARVFFISAAQRKFKSRGNFDDDFNFQRTLHFFDGQHFIRVSVFVFRVPVDFFVLHAKFIGGIFFILRVYARRGDFFCGKHKNAGNCAFARVAFGRLFFIVEKFFIKVGTEKFSE